MAVELPEGPLEEPREVIHHLRGHAHNPFRCFRRQRNSVQFRPRREQRQGSVRKVIVTKKLPSRVNRSL